MCDFSEPIDYEDFDEPEEIVDLRAYHVIGGVFHIDLLHIPPQPKVIKNWTVTICESSLHPHFSDIPFWEMFYVYSRSFLGVQALQSRCFICCEKMFCG